MAAKGDAFKSAWQATCHSEDFDRVDFQTQASKLYGGDLVKLVEGKLCVSVKNELEVQLMGTGHFLDDDDLAE